MSSTVIKYFVIIKSSIVYSLSFIFVTYTSPYQKCSVVSKYSKALSEYSRNIGEVSKIIVTAHRTLFRNKSLRNSHFL